jgi:hypothetical protein
MKVIVVATLPPFESAVTEYLSATLCKALAARGLEVERFDLPLSLDIRTMMEEIVALRLLDLRGSSDRLIAIGIASHVIKHDHKVVWLLEGSGVDLFSNAEQGHSSTTPAGLAYGKNLRSANTRALRESRAVFATSDRLREQCAEDGIEVSVLYPPLAPATADPAGDTFEELGNDWSIAVKRLLLEDHSS